MPPPMNTMMGTPLALKMAWAEVEMPGGRPSAPTAPANAATRRPVRPTLNVAPQNTGPKRVDALSRHMTATPIARPPRPPKIALSAMLVASPGMPNTERPENRIERAIATSWPAHIRAQTTRPRPVRLKTTANGPGPADADEGL